MAPIRQPLVPTSWGVNIRLNDEESLWNDFARCRKNSMNWPRAWREAIQQEKRAALSPEVRKALDIPLDEIKDDETYMRHLEGQANTRVGERDVAARAPAHNV